MQLMDGRLFKQRSHISSYIRPVFQHDFSFEHLLFNQVVKHHFQKSGFTFVPRSLQSVQYLFLLHTSSLPESAVP